MTETTFLPPPPPPRPAPPERKKLRNFFWPGFVIGFALLSLAGCGGLAMALGLTDLSLAEFQGVGAAWTPPTITASEPVTAVSASAEVVTDGAFQPGDIVRNVTASRVNVRMTPGHLGKPVGDIIAQLDPGATLEILGERASQDNLFWWRVNVNGVDGWVAEATASGVQILAK